MCPRRVGQIYSTVEESNILLLSHNLCFICYSGSVELTDWGRWEKELKEKEKGRVRPRTGGRYDANQKPPALSRQGTEPPCHPVEYQAGEPGGPREVQPSQRQNQRGIKGQQMPRLRQSPGTNVTKTHPEGPTSHLRSQSTRQAEFLRGKHQPHASRTTTGGTSTEAGPPPSGKSPQRVRGP